MKITVFTPTYNRGYIIEKLYDSLKRQTCFDFEWLVIDDGSTDNTQQLFEAFQKQDNFFPIRYYKVENGGKHRAINKAANLAKGELFFTVDSDDYLPDDAIENITKQAFKTEKKYSANSSTKIAGFFGLKSYHNGNIIGKTFEGEYIDISMFEKGKYNIAGDKGEVFYTSILKQYPYPEFEDEKFSTESIVWDRISHNGYKYRFFNKSICICEYLNDGLTHQGWGLYAKNPKQWGLSIGQNYLFGKHSWYSVSVQLYIYHLYLRKKYSISQLSQMTTLSKRQIRLSVLLQSSLDILRKLFRKPLVKSQYKED
ncbi:MAG: glycosyltransferase family 2 protein [Ruminococcaceae bacterium]|nr:glycosyltransferase family 2 protein [Oscillospiraceae bacterium]